MSIEEDIIGPAVDPIEEVEVNFYGDMIPVVRLEGGRLYVPIPPIAEALGLSVEGQRQRVMRDEVMAEDVRRVRVFFNGQRRAMIAIPLEQLPGLLFGVDIKRVKVELQEKLILYKREAHGHLWRAMAGDLPIALSAPASAPASDALTPAEQTLQQAALLYQAALDQVALERRMAANEAGLVELRDHHRVMADYVRGFIVETRQQFGEVRGLLDAQDRRLIGVERGQATSGDPINAAQATQLTQTVKLVADLIEQRTGKRAFGTVYNTLYNRFDIPTYKLLARSDFQAAMDWLKQWHTDEMSRQQQG